MADEKLEIVYLPVDRLKPNPGNPNEMSEREFNALCDAISNEGFIDPVQVVFDPTDEMYEIVGGEHRWKAGIALGLDAIPAIALDPAKWDQDRRDWNLVKLNIVHGKLNPEKFTALYDQMAAKYDHEVLQSLMGFTSSDAFEKVYRTVKSALPKELADALDDVKDEIRTIDDLSLVLNRLFAEYGDTLPSNFMVFSWGGKDVMWVRMTDDGWAAATKMAKRVEENGWQMDTVMAEAVSYWLAVADELLAEEAVGG